MDNDFHNIDWRRRDEKPPSAAVVLEPHVWVGNRVTILKGVCIGFGSVIAAGSVITKSVPPMSIAAGVPARVIRTMDDGRWTIDDSSNRPSSIVHRPSSIVKTRHL